MVPRALVVQPGTVTFWRSRDVGTVEFSRTSNAPHAFSPHLHDAFQLLLYQRGGSELVYKKEKYVAQGGDMVLFPPGSVHAAYPLDGRAYQIRGALIDASIFREVAREVWKDAAALEDLPCAFLPREVAATFDAFMASFELGDSLLERESRLFFLAGDILERVSPASFRTRLGLEQHAVKDVKAYLQDKLTQEVTLDELVAATDLPKDVLLAAFEREVGVQPHLYHLLLRLNEARRLLGRGVSSRAAAQRVGLDAALFERTFRASFGVSPDAYRRALLA